MKDTSFDTARARSDTPGCENVLHFNNAGASLMPHPVLDAVKVHLDLEASIGGYEAAREAHDRIESVYGHLAELLRCSPKEIAIVENATRAWDMAFYAIPFRPGDRILTSMAEYGSNYIPFLQMKKKKDIDIEIIPSDKHGQVSIEALRHMMDERVKLIAITHVPTNGGLVNPAAEIGRIARQTGALYLLDACQSVGQLPVDVQDIGCDMLSATGRKYVRGPRGTGFLYVQSELIETLEPPFLDIHAANWTAPEEYTIRSDARRFENWETNCAGKIGLARAVSYLLEWGIERIWKRVSHLAGTLRSQLGRIPGVRLHDLGEIKCGIVSFGIDGHDPAEVFQALAAQRINISVARRMHTRLDMESRGLDRFLRASVHYYNTEEEIDRFCQALEAIK